MLAEDYLRLQSIRLKSGEEWAHKQEGLCFLLLKEGRGRFDAGTASQRLAPGDVLVLSRGSGGKLSVTGGGELGFWCFSLCLETLFPLFAGTEVSLLESVCEGLKTRKFYASSSALAVECHRLIRDVSAEFNLEHRSRLLQVAAAVLTEEFKTARQKRTGFIRLEDHLLQVLETLSAEHLLNLSIGELAAKFGCGPRHLNRLFHQHFGFSVAALRMDMRMLKAMSLLRNPDAKVINVAEECGFNHLGLFNTCFKKRFGATPGQWRKKASGTESPSLAPMPPAPDCWVHAFGLCPGVAQTQDRVTKGQKQLQSKAEAPALGDMRSLLKRNH